MGWYRGAGGVYRHPVVIRTPQSPAGGLDLGPEPPAFELFHEPDPTSRLERLSRGHWPAPETMEPPLVEDPAVAPPAFELFHEPLPTPIQERLSRGFRPLPPLMEPPLVEDPAAIPAPEFEIWELFDEFDPVPRGLDRRLDLIDEILPDPAVEEFGTGPQQVDVGFLTGMQMRMRLYRAKSPYESADEVLLDTLLDGDEIFPNDAQIFTVDKASKVYFGPLILELTMIRRPNAPALHDAMFAIRFRKGR